MGKSRKPSPNVLHCLAATYAVPYEALMEKAGYLLPTATDRGQRSRLAAFAIDDLTTEEEEELLKYLAFIRLAQQIMSDEKLDRLPRDKKPSAGSPNKAAARVFVVFDTERDADLYSLLRKAGQTPP